MLVRERWPWPVARAAWTYSARPRARPGREDLGRLGVGLESALRVAHGPGFGFRLTITGGTEGLLGLSVDDGGSERWVERVLLRAYEPGSWRRCARLPRPDGPLRWTGRRRGSPRDRGGAPGEAGRLVRALSAALRAAGREATLTVELRPLAAPRFGFLDTWGRPDLAHPGPGRPPRSSGSFPAPVRTEALPAAELAWAAAVDLWLETVPCSRHGSPVGAAVSSAWTELDGASLRLRGTSPRARPRFRNVVSIGEVLALLPAGEAPVEPPLPLPGAGGGVPLGRSASGTVVALPVERGQGRHFAIVGETGMGKSSLLVATAVRASRLGSVILLDPLGETAEAVRRELRAAGRAVLWVSPGTTGAEMNALAGIGEAVRTDPIRAERELESLVHALRRVRAGRYVDASYWGPRLEEMLVRAVRAAASVPGGTLEDAHALLASAGGGRSVVPPAAQAEVRELALRVRDRPDDAEGARRLLYEIVRNPTLSRLLCARAPKLTIAEMVATRRPVLVSGSAAVVGEATARYLLATYLALVWSELLSRGAPAKTWVLLDEAQWFAHEGLGEMLRLARRRNVHIGFATQSLASLPEEVQDSARTNVADLVVFRGSPAEAQELARAVPSIAAEAILGLPRGEAAVLLGKGEAVRWVRTARLPDGPDRGSPEPEPPGRDDPLAEGFGATDGSALHALRRRASGAEPGALVEVDLGELRGRGDLDERELRALGSELGRRGAIVRSERTPTGPRWQVEATALAAALADRHRRDRPSAADSPQPS